MEVGSNFSGFIAMKDVGKYLVVAGLLIAAVGAFLGSGIGRGWFGQLPGDIHVQRQNFSFHSPIVTCVVINIALTLPSWLFRK